MSTLPKYIPLEATITFPVTDAEIEAAINQAFPVYTGTCRNERRKNRELREAKRIKLTQLNNNAKQTATTLSQQGSPGTC